MLTRWWTPVRRLAAAFFQHDVTLRREQGQLHVVLAERSAPAAAGRGQREDSERRRRHEELMLVRTELAALLNELPETRTTMRHLVFVEQALEKKGFKVLHKVPLDVLQRAHEQLENLVTNWSPAGLANLRSKMAVAIIDREHMNPQAEADAYRTAAVLDAGQGEAMPLPGHLPALPEATELRDDDAALAEAYAVIDFSVSTDAPIGLAALQPMPTEVEMQGELGSASARALLKPQRQFAPSQPGEISIRVLQP